MTITITTSPAKTQRHEKYVVAIDTFMTELSSVIRNCPAASVSRTRVAPAARRTGVGCADALKSGARTRAP
jgi:hypothetical protein